MIVKTTPTKIILPEVSDRVKSFLTIQDKGQLYLIHRAKQNFRWKNSDPEKFEEHINKLKEGVYKCLFKQDKNDQFYTYSGLAQELQNYFKWGYKDLIQYPESKIVPYDKVPPTLRPYQREAVDALLAAKHGAISLPTGSGKSLVILTLAKELGLKTIIMTPSGAITEQLYQDFKKYFGQKYVCKYGDGSKKTDKTFVVATAQALTRIAPETKEWQNLHKADVFISDESHTVPASTFEQVCMGIAANAPYRFFVSATQIRSDGSELLLKGITGPIVYSKDFKDLVSEKYLAQPRFKIFRVPSNPLVPASSDPNTETRNQLYTNPNVNKLAAEICAKAVNLLNKQVVIMVDEFKQFLALKAFMTVPFDFVHGGVSKDAKDYVPAEYWDCDREKSIKDFNDGTIRVLIGTSAISTGVDLRPTGMIIMLTGGKSEVQVKQAIGRGTRLVEGKKDFWVIDFDVAGSPTMDRHLKARQAYYEEFGQVETYG
jgi:superfamily II DNA or RNA helicase